MKTAFQVRVPADADPRLWPVKLIELEESEGWLGQTLDGARVKPSLDVKRDWEQPVDVSRKLEIAPYADYPGDKGFASWFPAEDYARKWQQFCMNPNLPQWSEPIEPKGMTLEERFEQAQRLESSDPPAAANAYATFEGTQFAEAAAARHQDADFMKLCEAREQHKRMWIAEMTLQNPPRFGRFAANFHEVNSEPLATIAEAANILHIRYPIQPMQKPLC